MQARANFPGELEQPAALIEFNRSPGRIEHDPTAVTALEVFLQCLAEFLLQFAVEVTRHAHEQSFAIHPWHPFCRSTR